MQKNKQQLPEVNFSEHGKIRYLHLGTEWVQGSMQIDLPFEIHLEYVQRMMAWLLFADFTQLKNLHVMQLGLGAASLTKFCHKYLHTRTTAIEINPQVIAACRLWFKLPPDTSRLQVILGDAAEVVDHAHWREQIDVLQVDLYDHEAAAPVLDSEIFYTQCKSLLTQQGCIVVNLFGRSVSFDQSLLKIKNAFGTDAVWSFKPTREGNTIVMAFKNPPPIDRAQLQLRAEVIESRWQLAASKWLKVFHLT